jgi:hypothetical protein
MAAKVKIPYYSVRRNGRGFWEPRPHMRALGFYCVPCGQDGPDAWAIAEEWNRRWQTVKRGEAPSPAVAAAENLSPERIEELTVYPPGSLGEAFRRYRRTNEWGSKAPRTMEDWWRGWRQIKPVFGDVDLRTVTLEDISAWRKTIEETVSLREAHRCLKIWRAMWKVAAALGYCVRDADPGLAVRNRAAPGRNLQWSEGEVVRQAKRAWRMGYYGLAAVIAVAWDTQLSPGDVVALRASQLARGAKGEAFFTERSKRRASRSEASYRHARYGPCMATLRSSASSCMAMRTSSATDLVPATRLTRSATISATCAASSSVRWSDAPSAMISVALAPSRRLLAVPTPSRWRTRWATPCRLPTRCLRSMCRST